MTSSFLSLCEQGWEEGLLGMKKAGRRLIVIPPNLAYGSKGVPNRVPANSTLIFEAELRRVTPTIIIILRTKEDDCVCVSGAAASLWDTRRNLLNSFCGLGEVLQRQWL